MGFLKKLFGGEQKGEYRDRQGIYLYVECDRCGDRLRLRVDKKYDLNRDESGYVWRKTIVDNKCFRPMETTIHFDRNYAVVEQEIEGGHYIARETFEAPPPEQAEEIRESNVTAADEGVRGSQEEGELE